MQPIELRSGTSSLGRVSIERGAGGCEASKTVPVCHCSPVGRRVGGKDTVLGPLQMLRVGGCTGEEVRVSANRVLGSVVVWKYGWRIPGRPLHRYASGRYTMTGPAWPMARARIGLPPSGNLSSESASHISQSASRPSTGIDVLCSAVKHLLPVRARQSFTYIRRNIYGVCTCISGCRAAAASRTSDGREASTDQGPLAASPASSVKTTAGKFPGCRKASNRGPMRTSSSHVSTRARSKPGRLPPARSCPSSSRPTIRILRGAVDHVPPARFGLTVGGLVGTRALDAVRRHPCCLPYAIDLPSPRAYTAESAGHESAGPAGMDGYQQQVWSVPTYPAAEATHPECQILCR
eukprot:scaffold6691_cov358-Prasinococcus_capsulatus_cf.AAC.23